MVSVLGGHKDIDILMCTSSQASFSCSVLASAVSGLTISLVRSSTLTTPSSLSLLMIGTSDLKVGWVTAWYLKSA